MATQGEWEKSRLDFKERSRDNIKSQVKGLKELLRLKGGIPVPAFLYLIQRL